MKRFVIAGAGTGVGKTVVSAVIVKALRADYWKPIQAGDLDNSDTEVVKELASVDQSVFHPEAYRLRHAMSPHAAAETEGIEIRREAIRLPRCSNNLVIEMAGGLMVPLNRQTLFIDLISDWGFPVILVSGNYLGSINHTLLSVGALQLRNIPVSGIIFNGVPNPASEEFILQYTGIPCLGKIGKLQGPHSEEITRCASELAPTLKRL